jgi:Tfp pilus assembly protein PilE
MKILHKNKFKREAFTLVDVMIALVVTALFGLAAFETNSRLLLALKSEKESTAATMALQERKESLRGTGFQSIGVANANSTQGNIYNIFQNPTGSEGPLSSLSETVTVDAYPTPTGSPTVLLRNSTYPNCHIVSNNANLSYTATPSQSVLRVDVVLTWTSSSSRSRTRQFSEIFTYPGNIGL